MMRTAILPMIALVSLFAAGAVQAAQLQSHQDPARLSLQSDSDGVDRFEQRMRQPSLKLASDTDGVDRFEQRTRQAALELASDTDGVDRFERRMRELRA
ncbi:hypothetical protein ACU6RQ_18490 [Zobellella denitrificans]